jgi:hypothetical protein
MSAADNLVRKNHAGSVIKPWIMLGAYNVDVSRRVVGLTYFEHPLVPTQVGYTLIEEAAEDARRLLAGAPCEGDAGSLMGQPGYWNLVRGPEEYLSWGTYNISNHLGAGVFSTVLVPEQTGRLRFRLLTRIYQRVLVAVAGKIVFDSGDDEGSPVDGAREYCFEAEFGEGENRVSLALLRVARMAQIGFRLECLDDAEYGGAVEARAPLAEGISWEDRLAVEEELAGIRFDRDVFYPEHAVGFRLETPAVLGAAGLGDGKDQPRLVATLHESCEPPYSEVALAEARPTQPGPVTLCQGKDLPECTYRIECAWKTADGRRVTGTAFTVRKINPMEAPQGDDRLEERRRLVLEKYANGIDLTHVINIHDIWKEVARYALGQYDSVDEGMIRRTCLFIAGRNDCADFVIQGVLRLMAWERARQHLSPEINALMKDTILGFKYWVDEPGDTVMYMGSENHRLLFHVAEWLAGLLYPTEIFTNSGQNGLFHTQKAYVYITEWLRQRGRFGYDEWHSNSYLPVCIAPLMNVYDFAVHEGQYKLRQMTQAALDQVFFYLAADAYQGTWGVTHGRSYGIYVKYADFDGTGGCVWLMYGTGALNGGFNGMAPVSLATSTYRPPRFFTDIATDDSAVVEVRQRQGLLRGTARHANFLVYRTPDYMVSGLQDHRKGEFESSTHVAQITLGNKAQIFWSCPHTTGEGSGLRPDYWSGNTSLPRVIQHKNVLALTWRLSPFAWMTHCWLEPARFDEVRLEGSWAFARVGKGYVGIYSQHGLEWGSFGQYAGRELQCLAGSSSLPGRENTWIAECGREADWGSFDAFVEALKSAQVETVDGAIRYQSPSVGEFVTGWEVVPTAGGNPIPINDYPLYDSPWAHADFGSGELAIQYGNETYEIWSNQ